LIFKFVPEKIGSEEKDREKVLQQAVCVSYHKAINATTEEKMRVRNQSKELIEKQLTIFRKRESLQNKMDANKLCAKPCI